MDTFIKVQFLFGLASFKNVINIIYFVTCSTQGSQKWFRNLDTHSHREFKNLSTEVYYRGLNMILVKVIIKISRSNLKEAVFCSLKSHDCSDIYCRRVETSWLLLCHRQGPGQSVLCGVWHGIHTALSWLWQYGMIQSMCTVQAQLSHPS